jgi:hypothetical protein
LVRAEIVDYAIVLLRHPLGDMRASADGEEGFSAVISSHNIAASS